MGFVEFDLNLDAGPPTHEQIELLVCEMFRERPSVRSVKLTKLPGGHMGLSRIAVLLAQPYGVYGSEQNPLVLRIGPKAAIADEQRRYEHYVEAYTGLNKVQRRMYATGDTYAVIAYDYLDQRPGQPMKTLRDFLWDEEHPHDLAAANEAVTLLFRTTLAQHNKSYNSYNDGQPIPDQRPLWFYNTVLPPALTLQIAEPTDRPALTYTLTELLALADQPGPPQLIEETIELQAGGSYPHLRVDERGPQRLRLYLYEGAIVDYEGAIVEPELYGPPLPVAARIDLIGSPGALAALPDDLDQIAVRGQIVNTRYAMLEALRQRCVAQLPGRTSEGRLLDERGIPLKNPILCLHELLAKPRTITTALVHGDMNLGNILISRAESGTSVVAWMIDFDKTAPGQHAVFDAVKLETEYKVQILAQVARDLDDLIHLEGMLHQALVAPDQVERLLRKRPHLHDAYEFLATVRRVALQDLKHAIAPEEYYLGLIGYGLAVLKYDNLYSEHNERWLWQHPAIDPLALAAYASASYTATVIDACANQIVGSECYPSFRNLTRRRIKRPLLSGRDELLAKAQLQLRSETPVVLLYGSSGSGRGAVAQAICADLDRRGYLVWPQSPRSYENHFETIEGLLNVLIPGLRSVGVTCLPAIRPPATSRAGKRTREDDLWRMHKQLHEVINCLENQQQQVALQFWLTHADAELRSIISQIAPGVCRTALIIVTDHPFHELDIPHDPLLVTPLSHADIAAYVSYRQLPLDAETVRQLHDASLGRPFVLEQMLWDAQVKADQQRLPLNEMVRRIALSKNYLADAVKDQVQRQSKPIQRIIALDALVDEQIAGGLRDAVITDGERRMIITADEWTEHGSAEQLLAHYKELGFDQGDKLVTLLRGYALHAIQADPEYRKLCQSLAQIYRNRKSPNFYLSAYYSVQSAEWRETAAALAQLLYEPGQIFSARCPIIYGWLDQLFQQRHADYAQHERALRELAGMCAMYLGQYSEAIADYTDLLDTVPSDDHAYPQLIVRLLHISAAYGDHECARHACGLLSQQPRTPLSACGLAYEGQQLLMPTRDRPAQPDKAVGLFKDALALLNKSEAQWGAEADFFNEERAQLYDSLARAAMLRGEIAPAIEYLKQALGIARRLEHMPLVATFENNLGYLYYYKRGDFGDPQAADKRFGKALETRREIGDLVGQVRTAQNLANLRVNLATDRADWERANEIFCKYEAIAHKIQAANRYLIIANYMDALIDQGAHAQAGTLFGSIQLDAIHDDDTTLILLLNRAKLALWQEPYEDQRAECEQYLLQAYLLVRNSRDDTDTLEWIHIALGSHLLLKTPLHEFVSTGLEQIHISDATRFPERALWHLCRGLLAIARAEYLPAIERLSESRAIWSGLKFPFRTAVVAYWQTYCCWKADDLAGMRSSADEAEALLKPFGATPVRRCLDQLRG